MGASPEYDPRYLAGIVLFNRRDFFDAHEVWEDLWQDCPSEPRRFYQGLIQAAVALYHAGNGNRAGAARLLQSGCRYLSAYPDPYLGLAVAVFCKAMHSTLQDFVTGVAEVAYSATFPNIELSSPPSQWPDPAVFLSEHEHKR